MPFTVATQITRTQEIDLRAIPYLSWPNEARTLAKVVFSSTVGANEYLKQLDRKDWLVAQVERLQAQNRSIAEWLGEA